MTLQAVRRNETKTDILNRYAAEIRTLQNQAAQMFVRIGRLLVEAKQIAGRDWTRVKNDFLEQCSLSSKTAGKYIRIAQEFPDDVPDLPQDRLEQMIKMLARREDRDGFLKSVDAAALPKADFTANLEEYARQVAVASQAVQEAQSETDRHRAISDHLRKENSLLRNRLAEIDQTLADAPRKVREANLALRNVDMAVAECIQAVQALPDGRLDDLDATVARSIQNRLETLFEALAPVLNRR